MEWEKEGKYILIGTMLIVILTGALIICLLLASHDDVEKNRINYDLFSTIDSRNNTVQITEPNRTVNWNDYLVVVNGTFVMKSSQVAVPGITTSFYHREWDPMAGCCYDIEVVERGARSRVWNATVKAA
jgi:hypothetical protein